MFILAPIEKERIAVNQYHIVADEFPARLQQFALINRRDVFLVKSSRDVDFGIAETREHFVVFE